MGIRIMYFPHQSGTNSEQAVAMNAALVNELEQDKNPLQLLLQRIVPAKFSFKRPNLKTLTPSHAWVVLVLIQASQVNSIF